jgi:drug/metabolite transporter (DMT)-like permease
MRMRISTLVTVVLLVLGLVFAFLGFATAPNSQVSPAAVSSYMLIAAAFFAVLAVQGLRRKRVWQRFLGVAAVTATLYMIAMAILYFSALRTIVMPEF